MKVFNKFLNDIFFPDDNNLSGTIPDLGKLHKLRMLNLGEFRDKLPRHNFQNDIFY